MSDLRSRLEGIRSTRAALIAGAVVVVATVATTALGLPPAPAPTLVPTATPVPPTATPLAERPTLRPTETPTPTPEPTPPPNLLGTDGRLTVLFLGSDYRRGHAGNRTDMIMVASIDPVAKTVSMASIPRDTARIPLPDGHVYDPKINGLYQSLIQALGSDIQALREMERIIGAILAVEIDNGVVIGFDGVIQLIDELGGVDVRLKSAVSDPAYWLSADRRGVYFPAGVNHLDGARALIFARTRKGDNDFERARRQQLLIAAVVAAVRERGVGHLTELLDIGSRTVKTDLLLDEAPRFFEIVASVDLAARKGVVLGPRTYSSGISGTSSYQLKLPAIRDLTSKWFAPVVPAPEPSEDNRDMAETP
jgi:LCP family protein required for cell wall assembly